MCRIGGLFSFEKITNKTLVYNTVRKMLLEMEAGGPHATGIALIDTNFNILWYDKKGIPAAEYVKLPILKDAIFRLSFNLVLLHTRYATHGSPKDNINNHPFVVNKNVLIHNGVVSNYQNILNRYNIKLSSQCDSETIINLYQVTNNIKKTINNLQGGNAIALYDNDLNKLFIYGSGNPVELAYNQSQKLFIFNTVKDTIENVFSREYSLFGLFPFKETPDKISYADRYDKELIEIDFKTKKLRKVEVNDGNQGHFWHQKDEDTEEKGKFDIDTEDEDD